MLIVCVCMCVYACMCLFVRLLVYLFVFLKIIVKKAHVLTFNHPPARAASLAALIFPKTPISCA